VLPAGRFSAKSVRILVANGYPAGESGDIDWSRDEPESSGAAMNVTSPWLQAPAAHFTKQKVLDAVD
jgi:hypothetical protein